MEEGETLTSNDFELMEKLSMGKYGEKLTQVFFVHLVQLLTFCKSTVTVKKIGMGFCQFSQYQSLLNQQIGIYLKLDNQKRKKCSLFRLSITAWTYRKKTLAMLH